MKKILIGVLCGGVLFTGMIGNLKVDASELDNDSQVELKESTPQQLTRAGTINGIYYRVMIRTGKTKPRPFLNGMRLVFTQNNNGTYYGYYR